MFEKLGPDARRAVVLAVEQARQLDHKTIGTEHLLLSIIQAGGPVADALRAFGLSLERVRKAVLDRRPAEGAAGAQIPFSSPAKEAIERAHMEAERLGTETLSSAHLVLGILAIDDGLGLEVVTELSGDVDEIRTWLRGLRPVPHPAFDSPSRMSAAVIRGTSTTFSSYRGQRCGFCDRDLWEASASVAGRGVTICADCVEAAGRVLRDAAAAGTPSPDPLPMPPRVFGTTTDDPSAEAAVAALRTAITSDDHRERVAAIEDGATMVPLIEQAGARFAGTRVQLVIGAVRLLGTEHAQVRYEIVLGSGGRFPFEGEVVRTGDRWVVTRETIAAMVGRAGVDIPPPD